MSAWECGVCGYVHKEAAPPEKCPVCDAPEKMFLEQSKEDPVASVEGDGDVVKQWRCAVSGYLHTGTEPPEKCPICEATAEQFEVVLEEETEAEPESSSEGAIGTKRWRCTVCGYLHEGDEPPETCPVCAAPAAMFVEIDFAGKAIGELPVQETLSLDPKEKTGADETDPSKLDKVGGLVMKFHLHSIFVHFPNGILPAAVVFLAIATFLNFAPLEPVSFYNSIFVLITLPLVLFTGYLEWQKRYKGIKTVVFITKIISALTVLASVNVLVFWRLIDPGVAAAGSPTQLIYFGVAALALAAAGIAGHLGGKLVHAAR